MFPVLGIAVYTWLQAAGIPPETPVPVPKKEVLQQIAQFSFLTSLQQSVMNLGILRVQGLVNSFGTAVMAAFAAAVKIDSFAYMPVQDFGNGFSTFEAQNFGAGQTERIQKGIRRAVAMAAAFCVVISAAVYIFAEPLMLIFVKRRNGKSWPSAWNICGSKALFIGESAVCFCSMDCTAP